MDYRLKKEYEDIWLNPLFQVNTNLKIVDFLLENKELITESFSLNSNDKAIDYLLKNKSVIDWKCFCRNVNDKAVNFVISQPKHLINWDYLSLNPNDIAVNFLLENQELINWKSFSHNTNIKAIEMFNKNIDNYVPDMYIDIGFGHCNIDDIDVDKIFEINDKPVKKWFY